MEDEWRSDAAETSYPTKDIQEVLHHVWTWACSRPANGADCGAVYVKRIP